MILGGHSAGASTAVAYAAWDFGGHPGYRDIDGLVLIDGGLLGSFAEATRKVLADPRRYRAAYARPDSPVHEWTWAAQAAKLDALYRKLAPAEESAR